AGWLRDRGRGAPADALDPAPARPRLRLVLDLPERGAAAGRGVDEPVHPPARGFHPLRAAALGRPGVPDPRAPPGLGARPGDLPPPVADRRAAPPPPARRLPALAA